MIKNLIGGVFGKLKVVSRGPNTRAQKTTWNCAECNWAKGAMTYEAFCAYLDKMANFRLRIK